jgi:hypothetical protein
MLLVTEVCCAVVDGGLLLYWSGWLETFVPSWYRAGVIVVGLLLALVGAACGGDDEPSDNNVVMSTFTPRAVTETPASGTPTAAATEAAASPPTAASPAGTRQPTPTPGPNEIRPPELTLVSSEGSSVGLVAANYWFDPETETFSGFEFSGQVILATDPIIWPADTEATFEVQETSPFPAAETTVVFYSYDDNIATPVNPQGQVIGTDPAYVRQEDPIAEIDLTGPTLALENPMPAGKYIVDVTIHWPVPPEVALAAPDVPRTEYVYVVEVP